MRLVFKPRAAGWKLQSNPLSCGGHKLLAEFSQQSFAIL